MADKDGLSLGYKIGYNIRRVLFSIFGPAQQSGNNDPLYRLHRERERKIAEAKAKRSS